MTQLLSIALESPLAADLTLLFQRHTADMHAETPVESIHMMPRETLIGPAISFFIGRIADEPVAMGALKVIEPGHAEIKSMHVLTEHRNKGLSRQMLDHLILAAQGLGLTRVSLETGPQQTFLAARRLYERNGFQPCEPFIGYRPDPYSVFMTRRIT